jgi:hypothetical protein
MIILDWMKLYEDKLHICNDLIYYMQFNPIYRLPAFSHQTYFIRAVEKPGLMYLRPSLACGTTRSA